MCVCVCVWACVCVGGREIDETEEYLQKCIKNSYDVKYSIAQHFRCFRGVSNPTQKLFHELTFFQPPPARYVIQYAGCIIEETGSKLARASTDVHSKLFSRVDE